MGRTNREQSGFAWSPVSLLMGTKAFKLERRSGSGPVQPSLGKLCRPTGLHRSSRKPRVGVALSILAIVHWEQKRLRIKKAALKDWTFEGRNRFESIGNSRESG